MASRLTLFAEFDSSIEDWTLYSERFGFFLTANEIKDPAIQQSTLLSSVGSTTYKLIRNLCFPDSPQKKKYEEIVQMLQDHYRPRPAIAVERLKFHSTTRHSTETVSSYIARLRELSEFCNFGSCIDEMLRDRLICEINNPKIQKLLLTEPSLDFKKAQALAESAEAAEKSVKDVTSPNSSTKPMPF